MLRALGVRGLGFRGFDFRGFFFFFGGGGGGVVVQGEGAGWGFLGLGFGGLGFARRFRCMRVLVLGVLQLWGCGFKVFRLRGQFGPGGGGGAGFSVYEVLLVFRVKGCRFRPTIVCSLNGSGS